MARRSLMMSVLAWGCLAAVSSCAVAADAAQAQEEDALFKRILSYEFKEGKASGDLERVAAMVRDSFGDAATRARLEQRLDGALASPQATFECKQFVCRQLMMAGTARSVPALAALLTDAKLSHMARYAMERMPAPEAGQALRTALGKTKGTLLMGVVDSVGRRRDRQAVGALVGLMSGADPAAATAAAEALGKIAGPEATQAVLAALAKASPKLRPAVVDACLRCADDLLAEGEKDKAKAIYESFRKASEAAHVQAAALRGVVACGGESATAIVMGALTGGEPAMQGVAVSFIRDIPGAEATRSFAAQLPRLSPATQVLMINALADRGDAAAGPAVLAATRSQDEAVRTVALTALARLGDASAVPALAVASVAESPAVAGAARGTLAALAGKGVDEAIIQAMKAAEPKIQVELIKALTARRPEGVVPVLVEAVKSEDEGVRKEALKALGILADPKGLPALVKYMLEAKSDAERAAAERAVVAVAGRLPDEADRTAAAMAALPTAAGAGKAALLRVLGKFGGAKPLAAVKDTLKDTDPAVRDAAIRALAGWPDASAADALLDLAKNAESLKYRILALRGYVDVMALAGDLPAAEILKRYESAMALAPRPEDKKLVLSGMANVRHPDALKALQPYLADPALKAEAQAAIQKATEAMKAPSKVSASAGSEKAGNAIDGKPETRWDTGGAQQGGEWFLVELAVEQQISGLTLDTTGSGGDYPRGYEIYVSRDGKNWGTPVTRGQGTKAVMKIAFKPVFGRFVKIVQTGSTDGLFWSIHELKVEAK